MHNLAVSLPDRILADWHSDVLARMLAALRAVGVLDEDERRVTFARELIELCTGKEPNRQLTEPPAFGAWITCDWNYIVSTKSLWPNAPKTDPRASYLSCLFGGEFAAEREACRACHGNGQAYGMAFDAARSTVGKWKCQTCHGLGSAKATVECPECVEVKGRRIQHKDQHFKMCGCDKGRIPAPLMDPRWLSSAVIDLAKTIRNQLCEQCGATLIFDEGSFGGREEPPTMATWFCADCGIDVPTLPDPLFDRMPILADELQEAGCNNEEIIAHCMVGRNDGTAGKRHVGGCWVIDAVLGGK